MQTLYSYFKSLSFVVLMSASLVYGMNEQAITQQQPQINQLVEVPTLQKLCIDYIGNNAQQVNLFDNIINLSTQAAEKAILSLNAKNVADNKIQLLELAQSDTLDRDVLCAIAQKTKDVALAYKLASSGPITFHVAEIILNNFFKMDVKKCLERFDTAFNEAFPKDILNFGNDVCFYQLFRNNIATIYEIYWEYDDKVSVVDFKANLPADKIVHHISTKHGIVINQDSQDACHFALSPCESFLAILDKNLGGLTIRNLKTGNNVKVDLSDYVTSIDNIAFSRDSLYFGVREKSGNICNFTLSDAMVSDDLSLQKLAFINYYGEQLGKCVEIDNCKAILFQGAPFSDEEDYILMVFERIRRLLPMYMQMAVLDNVEILSAIAPMTLCLDKLSKFMELSKEEIVSRWFVQRNLRFMQDVDDLIDDIFDGEMLEIMRQAIANLDGYMYLYV